MIEELHKHNPFTVKYPTARMEAKEVIDLFVPVFNDFPKVPLPENTFIEGPRGSGKSMMFRYMMLDCQLLVNNNDIDKLDYFSIYIPFKKTDLNKTELRNLTDHTNFLLNEHILTTHISTLAFDIFKDFCLVKGNVDSTELLRFFNKSFMRRVKISGNNLDLEPIEDTLSIEDIFEKMSNWCEEAYHTCFNYCNQQLDVTQQQITGPYVGPITSFLNFLHPIIIELSNILFDKELPIYFLFDDADNLNKTQRRILNTWISYRFGPKVSIKVSSEPISYQTYRTLSGRTIDTPHYYSEVRIDTIYTTNKSKYKNNLSEIVAKRLNKFGIQKTPNEFFPPYEKQEEEINNIKAKYLKLYEEGKNKGYNKSDDAYRYSRPDFIKNMFADEVKSINNARAEYISELGGIRKQKSKYYYAGFDQLIHLSSGIVRFFLDLASNMYTETQKIKGIKIVDFIPPTIQNDISRDSGDKFLFNEFDKIERELKLEGEETTKFIKLRNLIQLLGNIFFLILISNASERRVFSIALSTPPDDELKEIFDLGVRYGYFEESTIGNKAGTGRTRLYIMNRRLAPVFTLDPTSFAGYKFITSEDLKIGIENPDSLVRKIRDKLEKNPEEDIEINTQMDLF